MFGKRSNYNRYWEIVTTVASVVRRAVLALTFAPNEGKNEGQVAWRRSPITIIVVFDSCRYDSFVAAKPKTILGSASWRRGRTRRGLRLALQFAERTAAARQPRRVRVGVYKKDFLKYVERRRRGGGLNR